MDPQWFKRTPNQGALGTLLSPNAGHQGVHPTPTDPQFNLLKYLEKLEAGSYVSHFFVKPFKYRVKQVFCCLRSSLLRSKVVKNPQI
jgi:hypothetical protein